MTREAYELSSKISPCPNPHEELLNAVKYNNIGEIKNIISKNPNVLQHKYDYPYYKPILYIACDNFADQVLPATIQTLIDLGANIHYFEPNVDQREAIHFAIIGNNPHVLAVIIRNIISREKINATADGNTALNLLIKQKDSNKVVSKNSIDCLDILLKAEIDVNKADSKNITPILWAAYKNYKIIIARILNCTRNVDIHSHKIKGKTTYTLIQENGLYDGDLPSLEYDTNENNINRPINIIKERRTADFLTLNDINVNEEIEEGTLLQLACERNLLDVVERLLKEEVDINKRSSKNNKYPLQIAAECGYYRIFKLLMDKPEVVIPENILTVLLRNAGVVTSDNINYNDCINILLDKEKNLPINAYSDTGNTPLHFASGYADSEIILKLLERGASLANQNHYGYLPIEDIDPRTLETHFDNCVTVKDRPRLDKQSIVVTFDYTTLLPTSSHKCTSKQNDLESNSFIAQPVPVSETGVVHAMSKIPEMHHLLVHPLISSFLFIKWHRMRWFFRINLLIFILFCASLIAYVFLPDDNDDYKIGVQITWFILILTYCALLSRELFQMVFSFNTYWCSLSNILEVILLCICFYVIFFKSSELLYKQLSSVAMILLALEMMVLFGQHPKLSTNIVMLRTVTKNFFLFLSWYSVLILAFVLCFYKLFNKTATNAEKLNSTLAETQSKDDNQESQEQDFFVEPGLTFIKTIVMLTGEFDASSIDLQTLANKIIFLVFVFMIPIILFNLLNGLAVSDTQMIKNEAEIMGNIERINYIVYIENVILGNIVPTNLLCLFQQCFACCELNSSVKYSILPRSFTEQIFLCPYYLSKSKMEILLYHDGKIISEEGQKGCGKICKDLFVDKKTVKRAKGLLFVKNNKHEESQRIKDLEETIRCQKNIIEHLTVAITDLKKFNALEM